MSAAQPQRDTYAITSSIEYRSRAVQTMLDVTAQTLRSYADNCDFNIPRASDLNPGTVPARIFDIPTLFRLVAWRRDKGLSKRGLGGEPPVLTTTVMKGGTGKSSTTAELGIHLQLLGLRVLLIDLDAQGSLTHIMGYESDIESSEAAAFNLSEKAVVKNTFSSLLETFISTEKRPDRTVEWPAPESYLKYPFGEYGPALIPADAFLDDITTSLINFTGHRELNIRKLLKAAANGQVPGFDTSKFDVILFDCPPALSMLNTNALAAADLAIAPVKMDAFSIKGLKRTISEMNMLIKAYDISPRLSILPTYFAPNVSRTIRMQQQLASYADHLSQVYISQSELFPKSLDAYMPLSLQNPTSGPVAEYRKFAEHIYSKVFEIAKEKSQ